MYFKLIACDVLTREAGYCIARTPHTVDVEFTEKGQHEDSDRLRHLLQEKIDSTAETGKPYDAVLLAYGLCGNATAGLHAQAGCSQGARLLHDFSGLPRALQGAVL